jgi:uncharacterized protein
VSELRFGVSDLLGRPGHHREVYGEVQLAMRVGPSEVKSDSATFARVTAVGEGLVVDGRSSAMAVHTCIRCLTEWEERLEADWSELFTRHPQIDESPISADGFIDLEPIVRDELSLALPAAPVCRPDCAGICPECGADLNTAPCDGHGQEPEGPFAVLKQLFGSET